VPSIGNWQFPCRSHYWIQGGQVIWSVDWTPEQVQAGQRAEEKRRRAYFDNLKRGRDGLLRRLWRWIVSVRSSDALRRRVRWRFSQLRGSRIHVPQLSPPLQDGTVLA
jgi:hypothetical protein